jgi:DNA-binding LacI/PurR family transcriptional regulator
MITVPSLTVAAQPYEMGRRAVAVLLKRLTNTDRRPCGIVLPTQHVIGRSGGGHLGVAATPIQDREAH